MPESNEPLSARRSMTYFAEIFFRVRAVKSVLENFGINKSAFPDGIPELVLKQCSLTLSWP